MNLQEIAGRITEHLKRFEGNPESNPSRDGTRTGLRPYYQARARVEGSRVGVSYISYQGWRYMPKAVAEEYLAWLDAGNVGTHGDCNWEKLGRR